MWSHDGRGRLVGAWPVRVRRERERRLDGTGFFAEVEVGIHRMSKKKQFGVQNINSEFD